MRCSHLRALRQTTALLFATCLYAACTPGEMVSDDGHGGSTGAAGASGRGGSTGAAGTGTAGTTGAAGESGTGGTIGPGAAGTVGRGGTTGAAGQGGAAGANPAGGAGGSRRRGGRRRRIGQRRRRARGAAAHAGAGGPGVAAAAGGSAGTTGAAGTGGPPPLKKFVGNIDTRGQVRSDFIMYWNQITPENAGKWGSVEGDARPDELARLDTIYDYAKQHNIPFKQHNFVWGSQQPGWIGGLSQADQRAEVEEWIRLFCERYPGHAADRRRQRAAAAHDAVVHGRARRRRRERLRLDHAGVQVGAPVLPERRS